MPFEDTKVLEFNQYLKSGKMMYIIYSSLEYLIKRINSCNNKPEKSNATNLGENIAGMQCLRYGHHGHLME